MEELMRENERLTKLVTSLEVSVRAAASAANAPSATVDSHASELQGEVQVLKARIAVLEVGAWY